MMHDYRHAVPAFMLISWVSVVTGIDVFAQDMGDMRLFYTPLERTALSQQSDKGNPGEKVAEEAAQPDELAQSDNQSDKMLTGNLNAPAARPEQTTAAVLKSPEITFNALLANSNGISVVLNGLPCKPSLYPDAQAYATQAYQPHRNKQSQICPHLEQRGFELIFNADDGSLTVLQEGALSGTLGVGDSL